MGKVPGMGEEAHEGKHIGGYDEHVHNKNHERGSHIVDHVTRRGEKKITTPTGILEHKTYAHIK